MSRLPVAQCVCVGPAMSTLANVGQGWETTHKGSCCSIEQPPNPCFLSLPPPPPFLPLPLPLHPFTLDLPLAPYLRVLWTWTWTLHALQPVHPIETLFKTNVGVHFVVWQESDWWEPWASQNQAKKLFIALSTLPFPISHPLTSSYLATPIAHTWTVLNHVNATLSCLFTSFLHSLYAFRYFYLVFVTRMASSPRRPLFFFNVKTNAYVFRVDLGAWPWRASTALASGPPCWTNLTLGSPRKLLGTC
jgi:hypothetical protein